jgi:O-antigen/teichoic acid export membrane protein
MASAYVLLPAFARISHDSDRFRAAFLRSARLLAALVLPISLALPPLGEQIALVLLGDRWRAAGHVLAALAGVTMALPLISLASEVFKGANRPDLLPRMSFLLMLGPIVLVVAFLPLGITGVAGGMSIAYVVAGAYALLNVARVLALPLRSILAEFWKPALASVGMAGVLALFVTFVATVDGEATLARLGWLAAEVLLGTLVYGVLLRRLAPSTAAELAQSLRSLRGRTVSGKAPPEAAVVQAGGTTQTQPPKIS